MGAMNGEVHCECGYVDAPAHARRLRRWISARLRLPLTALALIALAAAVPGYNRAVTPPYSEREYHAGKTAYRAGRYDESERHFEKALSREPDNLRFRRARGWARLKASRTLPWDEAKDKINQAGNDLVYDRNGNIDDSMVEVRAYLQAWKGNPLQVLNLLGELVKSGPLSAAQLNNRAYCCLQFASGPDGEMMLSQAEADLEAADALIPNCQAIYFNRSWIALHKGVTTQKDLDDIERAVQLGPPSHALYRNAALLYGRTADLRRTSVRLDAPIEIALFLEARPRRIERALYYARESIAFGQFPGQFILFKNLVPPSILSELVGMKQVTTPSTPLGLIEPVGELD